MGLTELVAAGDTRSRIKVGPGREGGREGGRRGRIKAAGLVQTIPATQSLSF